MIFPNFRKLCNYTSLCATILSLDVLSCETNIFDSEHQISVYNYRLEQQYLQVSQKLSNTVSIVYKAWYKEQSIYPIIRKQNYSRHQQELDEIAKNSVRLRFNMLSPAMKKITIQYLCDVLESESNIYYKSNTIKALGLTNYLLEEKRILTNLDVSKLDASCMKAFEMYIRCIDQCIIDSKKSFEKKNENRIYQELDQLQDEFKCIYPLTSRDGALALVFEHFDLYDYYSYALQKKNKEEISRFISLLRQAIKSGVLNRCQ